MTYLRYTSSVFRSVGKQEPYLAILTESAGAAVANSAERQRAPQRAPRIVGTNFEVAGVTTDILAENYLDGVLRRRLRH